jgi:hypothetical protein
MDVLLCWPELMEVRPSPEVWLRFIRPTGVMLSSSADMLSGVVVQGVVSWSDFGQVLVTYSSGRSSLDPSISVGQGWPWIPPIYSALRDALN